MVEVDLEQRIDYTRHSNRKLAAIPLAVLGLALLVIAGWYAMSGVPVNPGIEFTGGTELQLQADGGQAAIEAAYDTEISAIRPVATEPNTYIVVFQVETTTDSAATQQLVETAEDAGFTVQSVQSTSPSFGANTQRLTVIGIAVAFVGMSIVIFLLFRTFIPSIAVVISAFSDIMIPLAIMNLTGIKLSLGTVAALLMLIGYSVDSDILLTNHILRRDEGGGDFYASAYRAMRTGVTMTLTSLAALLVMAIVASLFGIGLLTAIGTVLVIGLAADLMNTYMLNLSLLRWYRGVDA